MKRKLRVVAIVVSLLLTSYAEADTAPASANTHVASTIGPACTSFCLDNNGYPVHGANLEHPWIYKGLLYVNQRNVVKSGRDPSTTGEYASWTSKYGSVTFNLVGYEYAWAGMNEMGLTISTMSLRESQNPAPDRRPPLDEPFWAQYQLDNCRTVEEVIASDAVIRILNPVSHFLVCDRTGECATIEFLRGRMIHHTGGDLPVKALTNNTYRDSVKAWRRGKLSGQSLVRFGIAADRARDFDPAGEESAIDYAFDTLWRADGDRRGGASAQWSIVFDAEHLLVYFHTKRNPQIRHLDFGQLDFSCGGPALMLDIHASLVGDISDSLEPYSHERSVEHFVQFFEAWGMDIPPDRTEALVQRLEAFPCANPEERQTLPVPPEPSDILAGRIVDPQPSPAGHGPWTVWLLAAVLFIPASAAIWRVARKPNIINQKREGENDEK